MLVKWPDEVIPGSVCNQPLIIEDFFPSILEMAGIQKKKTVQEIDGKSFIPLLKQKGKTPSNRIFVWHFPNKWGSSGPGIGTTSTIRQGDWKLIYWYKDGKKELYRLDNDLGEHNDLAMNHPTKVAALSLLIGNYLRIVKADRPTFKETNKAAPWPDEK
jgi:arylsulfatase A-like enzyme